MRSLHVLITILLVLVGYLGYLVYTEKVPCVTPITYGVGMYDEHAHVSKEEAVQRMHQAAEVWNDALGRKVFVAGVSPDLPVNFVYGALQETLDARNAIVDDIDTLKEEQKRVANEYAALGKQYEQAQRRGQATQEMKDTLDTLLARYYELQKAIGVDVRKHNALSYDDIEAGEYIRDTEGERIYVYGFESTQELESTLIHEFGHALGLGHVDDEKSVMYRSDKSIATTLSQADLAELARACSEQKTLLSGILNL